MEGHEGQPYKWPKNKWVKDVWYKHYKWSYYPSFNWLLGPSFAQKLRDFKFNRTDYEPPAMR